MNESLSPHETADFAGLCEEIGKLYPGIGEIQFFCTPDKHVSFWIVNSGKGIQEDFFHGVQEDIMMKFAQRRVPGFKCSLHSIHTITLGEITSQTDEGKKYMRSLCLEVENEFSRDEIHIVYQNQEFVIYGASPANRGHIQAVLISKIPYNLPCRANFQPQREWEDTHDVAHTIRVSNAAFADVGVPTGPSTFSGMALSLSQLTEAVLRKILPPQ